LLDRDGGREAADVVVLGLLHRAEELPGVARERLDVAALPLGVDRVEGERRLAGSRWTGEDDQRVLREHDVDAPQVVLGGAADLDALLAGGHRGGGGGGAWPPPRQ